MKNLYCLIFFCLSCLCCTAQTTFVASHIDDFPCEETRAVVVDRHGFVWVGTRLGLVRYDGFDAVLFHNDLQHPCTFVSCDIHSMCLGQDDDLWLGTFDGICRFNTRTLHVQNYRLPRVNYIGDISYEDGNVWAKNQDGVFRYDARCDSFVISSKKMRRKAIPDDLHMQFPGRFITASAIDKHGNTWVTIDNGGLWCIHRPDIVVERISLSPTIGFQPLIAQFNIRRAEALQELQDWQGINGLLELDNGTLMATVERSGLRSTGNAMCFPSSTGNAAIDDIALFGLAQLDSTHMLVGTLHHLFLVDNDGRSYLIDNIGGKPLNGLVLSVNVISQNDVWLGMVGCTVHISGNILHPEKCRMKRYDRVGGYPIGGVFTINKDTHGTIWFCSSEPSLMCYDAKGDSLRSVSKDYGIRGDNAHDMAITEDGTLWFTTNYGLLSLAFDVKGRLQEQHFYTQRDGLPASYLGSSNICALSDGRLCLVSAFGAYTILLQKNFNIKSNGERGMADDTRHVWLTDTLYAGKTKMVFAHDVGELSFHLSSLQYGNEHSQRFRYQLKGWDSVPRETAMGSNTVTYTNLHPGTYVFEYEGGRLIILIQQPLWWRWWARLLYMGIALCIVVFAVRIWLRQYRMKNRIRRMSMEQELYSHITHQLLAPVDAIVNTVEDMKGQMPGVASTSMVMLSALTERLKVVIRDTMQARTDAMHDSEKELHTRTTEVCNKVKCMTDVDKDFLQRCNESVTRHLADPDYSHRVMMKEVGASHSTLYRKLKSLTGMDTATFVREVRINEACLLLNRNPRLRISEVAAMVGYTNPKYFSMHFKAVTGLTPQQYKRK